MWALVLLIRGCSLSIKLLFFVHLRNYMEYFESLPIWIRNEVMSITLNEHNQSNLVLWGIVILFLGLAYMLLDYDAIYSSRKWICQISMMLVHKSVTNSIYLKPFRVCALPSRQKVSRYIHFGTDVVCDTSHIL